MGSKGRRKFKGPRVPRAPQLEQMQEQMAQLQASLAEATVTATVGGGAVAVEMTGTQELRSIRISPEVVDPEDVEMLQDLILAAFNEALEKSQHLVEEKLGPLTGGMGMPGLL